jgi:hypothetical protein
MDNYLEAYKLIRQKIQEYNQSIPAPKLRLDCYEKDGEIILCIPIDDDTIQEDLDNSHGSFWNAVTEIRNTLRSIQGTRGHFTLLFEVERLIREEKLKHKIILKILNHYILSLLRDMTIGNIYMEQLRCRGLLTKVDESNMTTRIYKLIEALDGVMEDFALENSADKIALIASTLKKLHYREKLENEDSEFIDDDRLTQQLHTFRVKIAKGRLVEPPGGIQFDFREDWQNAISEMYSQITKM